MHITCYCREIFSENCRRPREQTKEKSEEPEDARQETPRGVGGYEARADEV